MKKIKLIQGLVTGFLLVLCTGFISTTPQFAASTVHVRIVDTIKTLFTGDITLGGCTITDESSVSHTFATPFAICALDGAAKQANITYKVKDFGGSLGLFIDAIGMDTTPSDFSKFWSYDLNGQSAQKGVSSQSIQAGDTVFFHYDDPSADSNLRPINDGVSYLKSQQTVQGDIQGFSGVNAWASQSFSAAGIDPDSVKNGGKSLLNFLMSNPPADTAPATDWEKAILAITAAGQNPFTFGGINYVAKLESFDSGSQIGLPTQVNDDVFGLLALIASGPGASGSVKQDALNFILKNQQTDGGFSWSTTGTSDVDDTAAAVEALVAAQNNGLSASGLSDAITKAKAFLLSNQKTDGSFVSSPSDSAGNTASTSWAAMALSAMGMGTDQKEVNALSFIRGNQQENGSFFWQSGSTGETFTTSYAIMALEKKSWPLGIFSASVSVTPTGTISPTPTQIVSNTPTPTQTPTVTPTPTITSSPSPSVTATPTQIPSPTPTVTVTPSPSPILSVIPVVSVSPTVPVSSPSPVLSVQRLGGLNLDGYCASLNEGSHAVVDGSIWSCGSDTDAIDITKACQWQYQGQDIQANQETVNNPYSWACFSNSQQPTPTPQPGLLGGLNLDGFCASQQLDSNARVKNGKWYCGDSSSIITIENACAWQYKSNDILAQESIPDNAYSWTCYSTKSALIPTQTPPAAISPVEGDFSVSTVSPTPPSDVVGTTDTVSSPTQPTVSPVSNETDGQNSQTEPIKKLSSKERTIYQELQSLINQLTEKLHMLFG